MSVYHLKLLERRWSLVHASTGSVLSQFKSFREAMPQSAADVARRQGCLVIYRRDGSILEWRRFGGAQPPPASPLGQVFQLDR